MRRALTVVAATVLAVACAELGLRLVEQWRWRGSVRDLAHRPPPPTGARASLGDLVVPSMAPGVVYELRPNLDVRFKGVRVRTDAAGLRGPEVTPAERSGGCRLVGLGDSVMFGWGVTFEDSFLGRAAAELGPSWQVLNAAVPGSNTAMQAARLEAGWERWLPDVVVLHVVANDLELPPFLLRTPSVWSLDRSALWRRVERVLQPPPSAPDDAWTAALHPGGADPKIDAAYGWMVGIEGFRRAIGRIARRCGEHDVPVLVLLADDRRPPWSDMAAAVEEAGLHAVRTVGAFDDELARRGLPRSHDAWRATFWLSASDPHPNAVGHEVLARSLLGGLDEVRPPGCGRAASGR